MGISDLYNVLKLKVGEFLIEFHYSELAGQSIAIDTSIFLYKYIRTAGKPDWISIFISFLCGLKKHGLKLVCIFDGPNPPPEKRETQLERRKQTQKQEDKLVKLIEMKEFLEKNYLRTENEITNTVIGKCQALLKKFRKEDIDTTDYSDVGDIIQSLNCDIAKLTRQTLPIVEDDRMLAYNIAKSLGLASLIADGEAETLCAFLAVNGYVDAVLTEDTDVLAYGTPLMLTYRCGKFSDEKLYGISMEYILNHLEMNLEEFRDLCIMLSCDYNSRVKGFPPDGKTHKKPVCIGMMGALAMIEEYRRLEEVEKYLEDPEPLNYKRVRTLLTVPKKMPLFGKESIRNNDSIIPLNQPLDMELLRSYLPENQSLEYILRNVERHFSSAKVIFEGEEESEEEGDFSLPMEEEEKKEFSEKKSKVHFEDEMRTYIISGLCYFEDGKRRESAHVTFKNFTSLDLHMENGLVDLEGDFEAWVKKDNEGESIELDTGTLEIERLYEGGKYHIPPFLAK